MPCLTKIPYTDIAGQHKALKEKLLAAMSDVLEAGEFVLGPQVQEFEERFAKLCGTKFAVGVNSGTDAIILALRALDVGPGDEVITVPNGFISTLAAVTLTGARPVLVDVGDDYNLNPHLLEKAITPKTKAIIPVHLTGRPCRMDEILNIANEHNVPVVEDAAQAVSAEFNGQKVGSFGVAGCFSLHPLKTLNACGDGGVLTTNVTKIYEAARVMRNNGFRNRDECVVLSNNSRLDSLQAAVLLVKMDHLDEWTDARRRLALVYRRKLAPVKQIQLPPDPPAVKSVYHTFVIQAENRDGLKDYLKEQGVSTKIHYPVPIHLQPAARGLGYKRGDFPAAEKQSEKILSLPIHSGLEEEQVNFIARTIQNFYE